MKRENIDSHAKRLLNEYDNEYQALLHVIDMELLLLYQVLELKERGLEYTLDGVKYWKQVKHKIEKSCGYTL